MRFKCHAYLLFLLITFFGNHNLQAQKKPLIHIKKNQGTFYFFQKGIAADSLAKNKHDLFYLLIPDSLKPDLIISTENGQLRPTTNDSLFQLIYLQGVKYENLYQRPETKKPFEFVSLINGASGYETNKIFIQVISKKENRVLLENTFFYKQ